jgi:hypothetical protein
MSISGSTITRSTTGTREAGNLEAGALEAGPAALEAVTSIADISCWRLLTARVPLTLLLDLAVPSAEELAELYEELLDEPTSLDWVPVRIPAQRGR